ncbi:MAG: epoxyqueuosine reductase QueH [Chloroflexi bacterium]|nr:epoxyqueuosine reductase QueH [Chloroflexota bacterium]MBU1748552.1 epoxyqueuosine reductase QueH [Chloroflexota bacterium]MBU1879882.1 epoxyqueuosine reductase QueH [Chloroflexota bacterium]
MDERAMVLDATGQALSPTGAARARRLVATGRATLVCEDPLIIRLLHIVELPAPPAAEPSAGTGQRLLLHACCAPCATYTVGRLRNEGFAVAALWYNPNIAPAAEHDLRRASMRRFADRVDLTVTEVPGYPADEYERAITRCPARPGRCEACYRLRLGRAAQVAGAQGFDAFTTTLLISPYQDQDLIRGVGTEMAQEHGVAFYFENFRRGWGERGRLTREYGLYRQQYCGCASSAVERGA